MFVLKTSGWHMSAMRSRDGTVVRALASHQCGPCSIPARCYMWVEYVVGSRLAPRVFKLQSDQDIESAWNPVKGWCGFVSIYWKLFILICHWFFLRRISIQRLFMSSVLNAMLSIFIVSGIEGYCWETCLWKLSGASWRPGKVSANCRWSFNYQWSGKPNSHHKFTFCFGFLEQQQ